MSVALQGTPALFSSHEFLSFEFWVLKAACGRERIMSTLFWFLFIYYYLYLFYLWGSKMGDNTTIS
jgi:hypothetical protein